jgi:PHD/YefM family antitoxin component YafN of YafNO toxin-antitoxin module
VRRDNLAEEILGITAAKVELPRRVASLQSGELGRVVLVKQNNPVAVILTIEEYERMSRLDELNELHDDLVALFEALDGDDPGSRISLDDVKRKLGIK